MKLRHNFTVAALALAVAVWPALAVAGNPHGDSGHANGHGKVHAHGHGSVHVKGSAKVRGHVHVRSGSDVTGHAHGWANSNVGVKAHAKVHGQASIGVGVKSSNATSKNTFAAAGSAQTKLYGNGKTAGEIAMENGAQADTMLYGPGNSQPHKVSCGSHWIDVHALKAHAGACAGAEGSIGASAREKVYGNGMTAAQIAIEAGLNGGILFGAGNSGLHKVACGAHLIDVHALKAHAGACAGAGEGTTAGVQASGQVSAGASGQTQGTTGTRTNAGAGAKAGGSGVLGASSASPGNGSGAANGVLGASTSTSGTLPFTGVQLSLAALLALTLIAGGLGLRRAARTHS